MSLFVGATPKWIKDFKWSDLFGGVKEDIQIGAKTVQEGAKAVLGGVTSTITPTVIWIVVILVVGLLLYGVLRKIAKI